MSSASNFSALNLPPGTTANGLTISDGDGNVIFQRDNFSLVIGPLTGEIVQLRLQCGGATLIMSNDGTILFGPSGAEVTIIDETGFWDGSVIRVIYGGGFNDKNGQKILDVQQPAIADTTGATLAQLEATVNALKAMLRAHGLIVT